ncbi:conserved hypothetical protein [Ricinus communis]|uniref:Uncharacterized protein n=1 Tax=Ricinus communis TaxID=3988 RepID=B9RUG4_RICCO|nr:conserved hypothetical protein [Ricinus communis]
MTKKELALSDELSVDENLHRKESFPSSEEEEIGFVNKVKERLYVEGDKGYYKCREFLHDWNLYKEGQMAKHDLYCQLVDAFECDHQDFFDELCKFFYGKQSGNQWNITERELKLFRGQNNTILDEIKEFMHHMFEEYYKDFLHCCKLFEEGHMNNHDLYCELIEYLCWHGDDFLDQFKNFLTFSSTA